MFKRLAVLMIVLAIACAVPPVHAAQKGTKKAKAPAAAKFEAKKPAPTPTPLAKLDRIHPYLTFKDDPAHSIVVSWWNPEAAGDSAVAYGPTAAYGQTAANPEQTRFHHVELKGLTPGATYHYKIASSDGTAGEDNTFSLPEENDTDFMFSVSGDTRGNGQADDWTLYIPRHRAEYDKVAARRPDFVINIGDLVNKGSDRADFINFFNCEQNALKRAPYMIAMGNHEVQGPGQWPADYLFYQLFAPVYPANGTPDAKGMNYSFDYGNAHFVFLSSYKMSPESQVEWLDRDLTAARANPKIKWLFAAMHAPLYSWVPGHPAEAKEVAAWGPVFDKHHVDLVFEGHNHLYERTHVIKGNKVVGADPAQGTIYITSGLGGGPFNACAPPDPQYPFIYKSYWATTASTYIKVQGTRLEVKEINVKDEVVDQFEIKK